MSVILTCSSIDFRTDLPGEYFVQVRLVGDESRAVVKKARLTAEARGIKEDIEITGTVERDY